MEPALAIDPVRHPSRLGIPVEVVDRRADTSRVVRLVFVPGEPVLSGGRDQVPWQEVIRSRLMTRVINPKLTFVLSSLKRRGHPFDLDNLIHPVLMVLDDPIDHVSARAYVGEPAGLLIEDEEPAPHPQAPLRSLYLETHSEVSARGRPGIPLIGNDPVYHDHEGLGLSLVFDRADIPIRHGWFGPTESVIDDLLPWFGSYTSRGLIADHRIRDLRITRGRNAALMGVHISLWYVPDDEVVLPLSLRALVGELL